MVAVRVFGNPETRDHIGVNDIGGLILIPVNQVIAVEEGTHINICSIVAEHLGEEVTPQLGGVADNQLLGERLFLLLLRDDAEGPGDGLPGVCVTIFSLKEPAPLIGCCQGRSREGEQQCKAEDAGEKLFHPEQPGVQHILIHSSHPHG